MNQSLDTPQLCTVPTAADLALIKSFPLEDARLLASVLPDGQLPKGTSISPAMRQRWTIAADSLEAIMEDSRPQIVVVTVTFLLSSFPRQAGSAEAADLLVRAYEVALDGLPTWSIEEAARRWLAGMCGPRAFAPTPPELTCAARDAVAELRGKIISLRRLAKIKVAQDPTPEQLERRQQLADNLRVSLKRIPLTDESGE